MFYQKYKKKFTYLCLVIMFNMMIASMVSNPITIEAAANGLSLEAESAILMEASTGQVLYESNADMALPPASMSKMMTELLVLESIAKGEITWDSVVTAGENAETTIGSQIFLAAPDKHTVEDLYIAMAIYSANDASVALAEYIAGSEEKFAVKMNEKAREIGLSEKAHFINSTGLNREDMIEKFRPTTIQGETLLTAKDSALIAKYILQHFPEATDYSSIPTFKFRERDKNPMYNLNRLLEAWIPLDNNFSRNAYEGLDGFKTGHTKEAGYCFTGTAERNGMRLISVVMKTASEEARFEQTVKLLDYGFNNFEKKILLTAKTEIDSLKQVNISKGKVKEVALVTEEGIEMMVKKGVSEDMYTLTTQAIEEELLVAPIQKGDVLGTVTLTYEGTNGADGFERQVNLVAVDDVEKAGWFSLFFRAIGSFFKSLFNGIKGLFG